MSEAQSSSGVTAPSSPRRWLVLVIVSVAFLIVELDITIVNVALPSIQTDLRFPRADLQWVVNAYLLTFGGFVLLAGRAADLLGRKHLFLAGVAVFGIGSALSAVAPSMTILVIGRALQGLGGAMLAPTGMSLLTTTFTDPQERTRALGVWTFILSGSVAIGLTAGGVITDVLSWRWIFVINLPVVILLLALAPRFLPMTPRTSSRGFDLIGAILSTLGPAALIFALSNAPEWGWRSERTIGLLAASITFMLPLVVVEQRRASPLIRLGIFRIRFVTIGNLSFLLTSSAMFGAYFFSTLYLQEVLGYGPLKAGLALLPLAVGILAGVSGSEPLVRRLGLRAVTITGLVCGVAGALMLSFITVDADYVWPFLPGLFLLSIGIGLAIVALTFIATSGVSADEAGLASGLYTTVSYVGGALGLAVLSTIAASRTDHVLASIPNAKLAALTSGYRAAYLTVALLMGAAAVLIATLLRRRHLDSLDTPDAPSSTDHATDDAHQ